MKNQLAQKLMAEKEQLRSISRCNKGDNRSEIQALDASGPPTQANVKFGFALGVVSFVLVLPGLWLARRVWRAGRVGNRCPHGHPPISDAQPQTV
jgi:hypothetical protein